MRRYGVFLLPLLALGLASSSVVEIGPTADEQAVMAADRAFYAASVTEKGQAWKNFADDDATLPAGRGKDAIGAFYDRLYAKPGFSLSWHPVSGQVTGDLAVTSGPYESHRLDESGQDIKGAGTYLTVWQRQKDGSWRFVWDGGTPER